MGQMVGSSRDRCADCCAKVKDGRGFARGAGLLCWEHSLHLVVLVKERGILGLVACVHAAAVEAHIEVAGAVPKPARGIGDPQQLAA